MPTSTRVPAPANLGGLKWRCIGPPRGGRVVAVAGDPTDKMVAYFGACAGGIWKTIDGGVYWRCVSDGFMGSAAVGAIAVARSDPNVIYAGTGETTIRLDVSYGDGVYRSTDAGRTWANVGLKATKHIGRICIHPRDPDIAFVAALGDIFGPNDERGVFRTRNGGRSWEKVLHRSADAGAVDLSLDPDNPRIVFASFWETRRNFWNISSGGPGSGLFRSTDGGDTWEEISRAPGLPDGPLGKLGVSISPARSGRVFALVEAIGEKTGLYRSDDYGGRWIQVSSNRDLMHRPWYYAHVFADTRDPETVYVANYQMWKSTDGGSGFSEINTPHGDNHDLWIDPVDPNRLVQGNDGGACVSFNGGTTWSSIYNQSTAQFYRIDVDNQYPYKVYGTQQDNTSIAVPSATVWGAITLGDCSYPGTGESGFIAVHPKDPNIVYCGAIGSSPGGAGALQRYDYRTGQIQLVNVWPEESTGIAPKDLKYRFAWTYPIVFSPHDSNLLYAAGNHVFRTRDEGMSWEEISPDLSLNDVTRQGHSGGDITHESAGAEVHASCASLVESMHRKGEIWASTDDGLVHVTRDDGASWRNVTPPGMPALAYIGCVEISPHHPDTIYVAATRYKLADYEPYLFRSTDSGNSWHSINGDFPAGEITRVVRADPLRQGLLFAGTETGVFFTLDDGQSWARLPGGLPVVPVYDLKIKGADLIAGTHGRSFWILDDISPLRAFADGNAATRLIPPRATIRSRMRFGALGGAKHGISFALAFGIGGGIATVERPDGTKLREHLDVGENPPNGVIVYYWLGDGDQGPVALAFRDAEGTAIATMRSDDTSLPAERRPRTRQGLNRYIWDMRHKGPVKIDTSLVSPRNKPLTAEPDPQAGPLTVPGDYRVELTVGSSTSSADFTIVKDPRLKTPLEADMRQFELLQELTQSLSRLNASVNRIRRLTRQLGALADAAGEPHADLADKAKATTASLKAIESILVDVHRESPRDVLRHPAGLDDTLVDLINTVAMSDTSPTAPADAVSRELMTKVEGEIAKLDALLSGDIAAINAMAAERRVAHVAS
ncbi:Sortilin, neurotensin receptor 3 [Rhizobiales bacterium GAS191]|nr:Sortilin, neurotensin receptor 3 [Rhizobiales bacterium GAS113]SEE62837.1 Sortilin, neurotensin receptor 3 [Rhizobiales bacterium GAS191]